MITSELTNNQPLFFVKPEAKSIDSTAKSKTTENEVRVKNNEPKNNLNASGRVFEFSKLQTTNSDLNLIARNIRVVAENLDNAGKRVDQMKNKLDTIVKQYPPFPNGSEERVRLLNSFTSLRRQIDQLTFPPEAELDMKILGVTTFGPEKDRLNPNGESVELHETIQKLRSEIDPEKLDIPELAEDASDTEIYATIESLKNSKNMIDKSQIELTKQVKQFNNQNSIHFPEFAEDDTRDLPEFVVEDKSVELKERLVFENFGSLTGAQSKLSKLLA